MRAASGYGKCLEKIADCQEIIDEAHRPDSAIHLQTVILDGDELTQKTETVVTQSQLANKLGLQPKNVTGSTTIAGSDEEPHFTSSEEEKIAQVPGTSLRNMKTSQKHCQV